MIQLRLLGPVGLSMADGAEVRAVLTQPKRLALLAYLAAASPGVFHRRDALLALFWPDCTERQARLALRQALHHLRRALGASVIANRGGSELGLAPGVLWCDATAFRRALCDGEPIEALELYRGDFLEAFSMHGISIELERWLEEERLALRALAFGAASALSEGAANEGELALGIQWARRALALSAGDESALRRLVRMLDQYGDRAGALRTAEMFARRMRQELDAEPAPETAALLSDIRSRAAVRPSVAVPVRAPGDRSAEEGRLVAPPHSAAPRAALAPESFPRPGALDDRPHLRVRTGLRHRAAASVGLIILAAAIAVAAVRDRVARHAPPIVAAGWIDKWGGGAAEPTYASLVARRFYEEGLRTYYQIDVHRSNRFFRAALREDSTCAMCAYYAAISMNDIDPPAALGYFRTALRLASRAPERDRLYIQVAWKWFAGVPTTLSTAESLAALHPDDPTAQYGMASALVNDGRFEEAASFYRRVIDLDSVGLRGQSPQCRACDAEEALIRTYWAADSFTAAEREARAWIYAQPRSRRAWYLLAETYQRLDRYEEALAVRDAAGRLWPAEADDEDDGDERAVAAIRRGDFEEADAYFAIRARDGSYSIQQAALWWLIISLRNQGRLAAAMDAANRYQKAADTAGPSGSRTASAFARAQVMFEQGRFRGAAALFDSVANERQRPAAELPGISAHERCWAFTHEAASLAAFGDTAAVAALADSVERIGALSAYGLDRRLYLHLRGLLAWARRDRWASEANLRLALHSTTEGYTRANFQLGRMLLAERRPREAVAILQPALRGSLEASNYYVTRTELHEALAQAFTMLGKPDSAAAHDRQVVRAWAHADPHFAERVSQARTRLAAAERARAAMMSAPYP